MSHASLPLTRGLLRVSKWSDTPELLVKFKDMPKPVKLPNLEMLGKQLDLPEESVEWKLPNYDCNYLIKMMPPFIMLGDTVFFFGLMTANMDEDPNYVAAYYHYSPIGPDGEMIPATYLQQKDKTPQDALAKLLFQLFIEGHIWKIESK